MPNQREMSATQCLGWLNTFSEWRRIAFGQKNWEGKWFNSVPLLKLGRKCPSLSYEFRGLWHGAAVTLLTDGPVCDRPMTIRPWPGPSLQIRSDVTHKTCHFNDCTKKADAFYPTHACKHDIVITAVHRPQKHVASRVDWSQIFPFWVNECFFLILFFHTQIKFYFEVSFNEGRVKVNVDLYSALSWSHI